MFLNALNQAALDYGAAGEGCYSVRLAQAIDAKLTGPDISKGAVPAAKYKDAV